MSRASYVYKNIRSVSPHIKLAVFEAAIDAQVTMSDIIGLRLADYFGEKYVLSGAKSIGADLDGDQFRIKISNALALKIHKRSRKTGETESSVVLGILAETFGLIHEPVKRGRKRVAA